MRLESKPRLLKAVSRGREAAKMGDSTEDCPHAEGTRVWHCWMLGHLEDPLHHHGVDGGYDVRVDIWRESHELNAFATRAQFAAAERIRREMAEAEGEGFPESA